MSPRNLQAKHHCSTEETSPCVSQQEAASSVLLELSFPMTEWFQRRHVRASFW